MDLEMIVPTIALALGASFTSGINLYATVAVLGLLHRYIDSFALPADLQVLGSHWVIWPAVALYAIEFIADKVPAVDSAWDTVHTFIRVPAGAVIAAAALGDVPFSIQVSAGLVGGTLALGSHAAKATTRLAAHATGTSPAVSPAASAVEDVAVVSLIALIAANPVLSLFVLAVLIIGCYFVLRVFYKLARRAFRALMGLGTAGNAAPITTPGTSQYPATWSGPG